MSSDFSELSKNAQHRNTTLERLAQAIDRPSFEQELPR
jgi:hypothetical protein